MKSATIGIAIVVIGGAGALAGYMFAMRGSAPAQSLKTQAIVVSGLSMASTVKTFVSAAYQDTGRLPTTNAEAHVPESIALTGRNVTGIVVGENGVITVTYTGDPRIEGKTLELAPTTVGGGYSLSWSCTGGTVSMEDRPEPCRPVPLPK